STLGWPEDRDGNFEKFWVNGKTLQLAGKDQVRFQSIMWQGMLMSAGLPSTQQVFYHGFITSGGHKMSKSIGNVIDPISVVEEYGADALRYYLARHVHPFEDTDVTLEHFKEMYNANLANGLGNLAARIMQLAQTHLSEPVKVEFTTYPKNYTDALLKFEINEAIHEVFRRIQALDQKITLEEPFKVIKNDPEKGKAIITELVRELATIDLLLEPFMPETSKKIIDAILANKKPENLFPRKD
ncbi:MAG TPA: class I tRNA ligase family protein, partial [Candidatus Paceibacterota bacterium]|nr:class I tRNA ligase family protein [Candidatus Paceibacterota bacterium]